MTAVTHAFAFFLGFIAAVLLSDDDRDDNIPPPTAYI